MRAHRIHAALYDTMSAPLDVLGPRRRSLLSGLTGQILDVGAGTGANLAYLSHAAHIAAVDPDAAMRRKLAQRAAEAQAPVDISDASAEALPFPDEQFDAVLFTLVLCTISDPQHAVAEARRVLKPAGRLVITRARPRHRQGGPLAGLDHATVASPGPRVPPQPRHPHDRATGRIPLDQHRGPPPHAHLDTGQSHAPGHRRKVPAGLPTGRRE